MNIEPVIAARFTIDDAQKAFEALAVGTHYGKIVLTID